MSYGSDLSFLHFAPTKVIFAAGSSRGLPSEIDGLGGSARLFRWRDRLQSEIGDGGGEGMNILRAAS